MMAPTSLKAGLFLLTQLHLSWAMALAPRQQVSCIYDSAASTGDTCQSFSAEWGLTVQTLESLNPGTTCPDLVAGQNYCVIGTVLSTAPTTSSLSLTTSTSTSTTSIVSTSSSSSTSAPHQPQQTGTAANCDQFYLVQIGDSCGKIEAQFDISASEFLGWNPSINSDCSNILAGYFYCVDVPGSTIPVTTTVPGATTTFTDGITTPTPTQIGMTDKCNKFDLVQSGDSCEAIAAKYNIPLSTFYAWNPAVGSSCADLDLGYYVCVATTGYTLPTKTASAGNGITTPTPTQTGMTDKCNKFDLVQSGDSCEAIAAKYNIPLSTFYAWNPAVGSSCADLDLGYYVCVATTGYTLPTKTASAGNGITTPTPYEPGMVGDCTTFYLVLSGDTCAGIASSQGITVSDIEQWNRKVGSSCTDLWLGEYICVGV
ncbi:hypothetical protein PDIG_25220 [Penicillium digitatum PHI26]|uniref:LysM domain-containing protein n=1 Tax=Penicillium digitatum (strain PHI26 / CECT 20796) TaxID=1170229 RepID=K9G2H8_PEND2|nr:hypothetical protein PDIG_25220 [Penicillium digitatum PHI26]